MRKCGGDIEDKLMLDWRKNAQTRETARGLIKDVLDELPTPTNQSPGKAKAEIVFNHIFASYYGNGGSVYDEDTVHDAAVVTAVPPSICVATARSSPFPASS